MNAETKNRLLGLNCFLSDLLEEDVLISKILKDSGLSDNQIERIRANYLNEFLKKVTQNIFYLVKGGLSERYAKIIRFCYYLDGKKPRPNQNVEEEYRKKLDRIYELQSGAILSLRKKVRLQLLNSVFITAAKDILKNTELNLPKNESSNCKRMEYSKNHNNWRKNRQILIKKRAKKLKKGKTEPYKLPERPSHYMSEAKKAEILKKVNRKKSQRVPERVIDQHKGDRKLFNPWLGSKRYSSNWW